jgi:peptidoglycan/LPS O-acetylase OafA/YrhL
VRGRSPQLDLLRGIAVLAVIACHYPVHDFFRRVGWAGVDLFFVLSGFLISGLLFADWKRDGKFSIGRFFVRRGLKIYPGFYVFLLVTAPLAVKFSSPRRFISEVFFLQDYLPHVWDHTWSLGVEEKFYLVLPFVLLLLSISVKVGNTNFSWIPALSIVLLVGCLCLRFLATQDAASTDPVAYPAHLRMDSLFAGVALGYLFHFHNGTFCRCSRQWLFPAAILLLIPLALFGAQVSMLWFVLTFNTLGFSLLLLWIMPRTAIRFRPLERVGVYSYSIYLWHFFVWIWMKPFKPTILTFAINLAASIAYGVCAAEIIEFPMLRLRDKLFPASRPIPSSPEPQGSSGS